MRNPPTRAPELTDQQRAELDTTGQTEGTIHKAPWYYPLLEKSTSILLAACAGMALFIFNQMQNTDERQAEATQAVATAINGVQQELVKQRGQIEAMTDSMRSLNSRQDAAIATAERAMAEQQGLRSRVELLQYYLLELDAKAIAAGIKPASQAISTQMLKESKK